MELDLAGKTAVVTGASTGIGRAIAETLVAEGAHVFAIDINEAELDALRSSSPEGSVAVHAGDLSTLAGCEAAVVALHDAWGVPDILVNNVGNGRIRTFEDVSDDDWHGTFELNFFAAQRICRLVIPGMVGREGAAVVNVVSDLALQPEPSFSDYSPSKAALASLTKVLAKTYAPDVRVNAVHPGPIWTPLWSRPGGFLSSIERLYDKQGEDAVQALIEDRGIPLGRMGTPQDVANAVVFLASPRAGFITGSSVGVDGGTIAALN